MHELESYKFLNGLISEETLTKNDSSEYLNGVEVVVITEITGGEMRALGYVDSATPPNGYSSADYTVQQPMTYHNLRFETFIANLGLSALTLYILAVIPVPEKAQSIAGLILGSAIGTVYASSTAMWYTQRKYYHKHLGSLAQEIFQTFYFKSDYTVPVGSEVFYRTFMLLL